MPFGQVRLAVFQGTVEIFFGPYKKWPVRRILSLMQPYLHFKCNDHDGIILPSFSLTIHCLWMPQTAWLTMPIAYSMSNNAFYSYVLHANIKTSASLYHTHFSSTKNTLKNVGP